MKNKHYARLSSRIKAVFLDSFIIVVLMYGFSEVFGMFDHVDGSIRLIAFILVFVLYEPLQVSIFGATAGHFFLDLIVRDEEDETKKINFPRALLRFAIKYALGWLSLITINSSEKGMAIHDSLARSVVKPFKIEKE